MNEVIERFREGKRFVESYIVRRVRVFILGFGYFCFRVFVCLSFLCLVFEMFLLAMFFGGVEEMNRSISYFFRYIWGLDVLVYIVCFFGYREKAVVFFFFREFSYF